jgi:hypothetical protein
VHLLIHIRRNIGNSGENFVNHPIHVTCLDNTYQGLLDLIFFLKPCIWRTERCVFVAMGKPKLKEDVSPHWIHAWIGHGRMWKIQVLIPHISATRRWPSSFTTSPTATPSSTRASVDRWRENVMLWDVINIVLVGTKNRSLNEKRQVSIYRRGVWEKSKGEQRFIYRNFCQGRVQCKGAVENWVCNFQVY